MESGRINACTTPPTHPPIQKRPPNHLTLPTPNLFNSRTRTKLLPAGARAYYFRHIFHGQPTDSCVNILRQTIAAMRGRYSKILINELVVIPCENENASMRSDMALHGRSEAQWRALLGSVGLKIVGIWSAAGSERVIECVLSGWSVVL